MELRTCLSAITLFWALLFAEFTATKACACTDFQISARDGTVVVGRSLEWADEMNSNLRSHPAGEDRQSEIAPGQIGMKWKSRYGFVAVDGYDLDVVLDGMNEKGLSVGLLWMPGSVYPNEGMDDGSKTIDILDLGGFILGSYASVDETLSALKTIVVTAKRLDNINGIPTVHIALHDAMKRSAVVEFIDGAMRLHDNPNGVLTNAPDLDWHKTNLRNYIHISPLSPAPVNLKGTVLNIPGQGGGFLGIPGDWTPPSRFVRTSAMLAFAEKPGTASDAVNLAEHVLNAVDIPKGDVRVSKDDRSDYTQWVVIKDLAKKQFYFRTYGNLALRRLDFKDVDLKKGANRTVTPMTAPPQYARIRPSR